MVACVLLVVFAVAVNGLLYDPKECKRSREGAEYMGTASSTVEGIECQRWDSQEPHQHPFTDARIFPDRDFNAVSNYCRNPDLEAGPWCYTSDPDVRWSYCDVPVCDDVYPDCIPSGQKNFQYFGTTSNTESGKECRNWEDMTKAQEVSLAGVNMELLENNFCRNPDGKENGNWCFVGDDDTDWEYCAISFCKPSATCTRTPEGTEYVGKRGLTVSGRPCQRWDRQTPHSHQYTDDTMFPDANVTEAENFCRNPDSSRTGPWCYTTDAKTEWEFCDMSPCSGCRQTEDGRGYMGTESSTVTGFSCISWSQSSITDSDLFPDESMEGAANYCRNPDNKEGGPWCFIDDTQWEYCDVPLCEAESDRDSKARRTAKHILHIGIDGLHHDCWLNSTVGTPNFFRMSTEGSYTYSNARAEILTFSGPNWGAYLSGLGVEETGITSNDWEAVWLGFSEAITPVTGLDYPMPIVTSFLKGMNANTRTAAFYNWPWIYELTGRSIPGSVDIDFYCRGTPSSGEACDRDVTNNVTAHMLRVLASAESSYTFVHLDSVDASGHANGWCSEGYLQTVDLIDQMVGEMLDAIQGGQDVIVAMSSDHGGTPDGAHGREEDEHLLIPIWFVGPGIKSNYEIIGQVRNRDMVPTLLWSMGYDPSPYTVGQVIYEIFE